MSSSSVQMELGYSITSSHSAGVPLEEITERTLQCVEVAVESGFAYVQAGDHHAMADGQYLQNVPMLGRISATVDHLAAMVVLPLWDPVLLTEQLGTLDGLVDTLDVWCGIGWRDAEFRAFGVNKQERARRLEEALEVIDHLTTRDHVTFEGTFYQLEDVSINPKPAFGRVCLGGSVDRAIQRAGSLGDGWVASPSESFADITRKAEMFRDHGGSDVIVRRDALVLEDGERAQRIADRIFSNGYRGMTSDDPLLVGDSEAIRGELARYAEAGVDGVVIRPMVADHAIETLRQCPTAL